MSALVGKELTLCVSGSIAAFKAASVARLLVRAGAHVNCVLTHSATKFIGAATLSGITERAAMVDMFDAPGELQVELAQKSDGILVVPATADLISRVAAGRANDLVAALLLCARCPIALAPAMHPSMWQHAATQRNVKFVKEAIGVHFIGPAHGEVASGDTGMGRMAEPEQIVQEFSALLRPQDLRGRHIVVSAGPTVEDIDPVRFISNQSSGKMGYALVDAALARGATVSLVTGPVSLAAPAAAKTSVVRSAKDMQSRLQEILGPQLDGADALIMAAAVADYAVAEPSTEKIPRSSASMSLALTPNPDILAGIGSQRTGARPLLVGFAVQTGSDAELAARAAEKLQRKRCDLIVANRAQDALGLDQNRATLIFPDRVEPLERMPKRELADRILDVVATALGDAEV